jgi:hypothetical protein
MCHWHRQQAPTRHRDNPTPRPAATRCWLPFQSFHFTSDPASCISMQYRPINRRRHQDHRIIAAGLLLLLIAATSSQPTSPASLYKSDLEAIIQPMHCVPFRKSENSFCDDAKCHYPKSVADCSGNGICLAPSGLCKCRIGFEGDDCSVKSTPCVSGQVKLLSKPRGYFTDGSPPPPTSDDKNSKSGYRTDLNCTWAINPIQSSGEFSFSIAVIVEYTHLHFAQGTLFTDNSKVHGHRAELRLAVHFPGPSHKSEQTVAVPTLRYAPCSSCANAIVG